MERIGGEKSRLRQQLLTFYLLSYLKDCSKGQQEPREMPPYVMEAMTYLERNYSRKIVASELAGQLFVGRTSLMVNFKNYTGMTLHEYLLRCRLRQATALLMEGVGEAETAEQSGFCDAGSMIKSFRRVYGMTPKQYCRTLTQEDKEETEH